MLKALAHPARIAIIQHLVKAEQCICGDLLEELGLAQATISQHLKELKEAGLITGEIEGKKVCYCINEEEWTLAKSYMSGFFATVVNKDKCC